MTTDDLATRLIDWLRRLMPASDRRDRLTRDLAAFARHAEPLTARSCQAIEACAQRHARHLELHFDPHGTATPDDEPRGWPPADPDGIRARAAGVTEVRRTGGTCVLRLDSLEPYAIAQPYVDAAFTLATGAGRLVLDLRANGGGDPATVAAVAGRLLGDTGRPLSEVIHRDRRRQWWPRDPAPAGPFTGDVDVLISRRTYSSAEALAYHLQARGRVRVIGEPSRGAADHITPVQLTAQVRGFLPEATVIDAVTGGNWEGTGVLPDVPWAARQDPGRRPGSSHRRLTAAG